jgi:hypothetical protein
MISWACIMIPNFKRIREEPPDDEDYTSVFDREYFGVSLTKLVIIVWNS